VASCQGFKLSGICRLKANADTIYSRAAKTNEGLVVTGLRVYLNCEFRIFRKLEISFHSLDYADKTSAAGILTVLRLWNRGFDEGRNIDTLALIKAKFPEGENEWRFGERGARIRHRLHLEYGDRFDWPDISCEELGAQVFCYGLGDHFGILSDGTVIPCCLDREGEIALGNLFLGDNLIDILSSRRAEAIRAGFRNKQATEELCKRCGYARRFKL